MADDLPDKVRHPARQGDRGEQFALPRGEKIGRGRSPCVYKTIGADTEAAYTSGKLMRAPAGTTIYGRSGKTEAEARSMWLVLMPNVKGEDLGLPVKRMNASSPWMMRSGTPGAHIMMPQTASMDDMPPPPPKGT